MKLKNIGNKIISIGATVILPGEAKEVTGYPVWLQSRSGLRAEGMKRMCLSTRPKRASV